jgi:peptidoglycan hydrolase-like protein with peptidoglycan-binding domain
MPGYKIIESVGSGIQPVNKWSDIEHHHPSNRLQEDGRVYAKVNGKAEEIAGDYNGTVAYSPGGQLLVSKDFILKNANNDSSNVPVPSPANGYIGEVDRRNGMVTLLDRPGGEVMFRLRHMKIDDDIKPGSKVEYGESLGIQAGYGKGNPTHFGTHVHIDANVKYLDQADRYIRDMATGKITTDKHPTNTTNLVNEVPKIERISGNFPAPPKQALADGKIEFGEKGPDVALLQEKLRAAGARDAKGNEIKQDGDFGNGTKQSLEGYQKTHNLPVTGVADKQTLTALGVIGQQQTTPAPKADPKTDTPAPKPDTPAPKADTPSGQTLPANVQSAKTDVEGWHLGQTSAKYETSNRGPGFISTGKGDLGGKSYGIYQLSSTQGSLAEYVNQSAKYGPEFKGLTPASAAFDAKWKEVAQRDPQGFSNDQHTFIKKEFFDVQYDTLKGRGIDLSDRGRAVQDMLWSTSVQFRNLTPNVVANGLKDKFGEGYQLSKLSDEQIVGAVQDYKLKRNDSLFSGSPDLWPGLRDRAKNEKADLVELARDEQTLKTAGVKVPMDLNKGPSPDASGGRKTDPMADGVLKKGEEGPAVQRLQEALNKAGIRDAEGKPLPTTGYFGDKTEAAVRKYQEQKGLEVDGKAGKDTLAALGLLAPELKKPTTENKPQTPPADEKTTTPVTGDSKPSAANGEKPPAANGDKPPAANGEKPPAANADKSPVQTTAAPTQADKPNIANPNHPDHKLYQQAMSNLEQLGPSGGFKSRDELVNAAASVAADAKASGLGEISHVSRTTTAGGQALLVAVEGDPRNPAAKNSYIDYSQAVNQTVDQSTKIAEINKPATAAQAPLQQESPQQEPRNRGPITA